MLPKVSSNEESPPKKKSKKTIKNVQEQIEASTSSIKSSRSVKPGPKFENMLSEGESPSKKESTKKKQSKTVQEQIEPSTSSVKSSKSNESDPKCQMLSDEESPPKKKSKRIPKSTKTTKNAQKQIEASTSSVKSSESVKPGSKIEKVLSEGESASKKESKKMPPASKKQLKTVQEQIEPSTSSVKSSRSNEYGPKFEKMLSDEESPPKKKSKQIPKSAKTTKNAQEQIEASTSSVKSCESVKRGPKIEKVLSEEESASKKESKWKPRSKKQANMVQEQIEPSTYSVKSSKSDEPGRKFARMLSEDDSLPKTKSKEEHETQKKSKDSQERIEASTSAVNSSKDDKTEPKVEKLSSQEESRPKKKSKKEPESENNLKCVQHQTKTFKFFVQSSKCGETEVNVEKISSEEEFAPEKKSKKEPESAKKSKNIEEQIEASTSSIKSSKTDEIEPKVEKMASQEESRPKKKLKKEPESAKKSKNIEEQTEVSTSSIKSSKTDEIEPKVEKMSSQEESRPKKKLKKKAESDKNLMNIEEQIKASTSSIKSSKTGEIEPKIEKIASQEGSRPKKKLKKEPESAKKSKNIEGQVEASTSSIKSSKTDEIEPKVEKMSGQEESRPKKKLKKKPESDKNLKNVQEQIEASISSIISAKSEETEIVNTEVSKVREQEHFSDGLSRCFGPQFTLRKYFRNDLLDIVIDEISLEGLDGITIEALWTRLSVKIAEHLPFSNDFQNMVWEMIIKTVELKFHLLPVARSKLIIYNRFKYIDWDTGYVTEPDELPEDIYPYSPITDQEDGGNECLGSCHTFKSRVNITGEIRQMSLSSAEKKYGSKLIIVADECLRCVALGLTHAKSLDKLANVHYCILERIGRSRELGEVTAGSRSLLQICESKSLYYFRKVLLEHGLITKQSFNVKYIKTGNTAASLFHIPRFYKEYKSMKMVYMEQIIDVLKRKPDHRLEYVELKKIVGLHAWYRGVQKLVKSAEFRQYVKVDVMVPYRTMYPNASEKEWRVRNRHTERYLRILQLINPSINLAVKYREEEAKDDTSGFFPLSHSVLPSALIESSKYHTEGYYYYIETHRGYFYVFNLKNVEIFDLQLPDNKHWDTYSINTLPYFCFTSIIVDDEPIGEYALNASIFNQTYDLVYESGSKGITLKQVQRKLGMDYYVTRSVLTNLVKRNLAETRNVDYGRLHLLKYFIRPTGELPTPSHKATNESSGTQIDDDSELSFIANILEVDKDEVFGSNQATNSPPEIINAVNDDNPFKGHFDFIKQYRKKNRLEKINKGRQVKLLDPSDINLDEKKSKAEERAKFEAIFKNEHPYYSMELSLDHKRITPLKLSLEVGQEFVDILNMISDSKSDGSKTHGLECDYLSKNVSLPTKSLEKIKASSATKVFRVNILLGSADNASSIMRRYIFLPTITTFDDLIKKFHFILKDIRNKAKSNKLEYPADLNSEDECYPLDENYDTRSLDINLEEGEQFEYKNEDVEVKEFKSYSIRHFETAICSFNQIDENLILASKRKAEDIQASSAKRIKTELPQPAAGDDAQAILKEVTSLVKMEIYMGKDPVLHSRSLDEDNIETTIITSKPLENLPESEKYINPSLSQRSLARANMILDNVYSEKSISDTNKLLNMIKTFERQKRILETVDRKSVARLLHRLVESGHIRMWKIILKYENVVRCKNIVAVASLDMTNTVQVFVDQQKIAFFIYVKEKRDVAKPVATTSLFSEPGDINSLDSIAEMKALTSTEQRPKYKYSRTVSRQYGYVPKFAKMKMMHELLFYLIYAYDGEVVNPAEVPDLLKQFHVKLSNDSIKSLGPIYKRELSWKMFIPPLPKYKEWLTGESVYIGSSLICDIILRLPLSIFVKIFNIGYIIPELVPLLNDPVKRYVLLKNIPVNIRNACLHNRKCIFSIHEILCHLCYIGLLQFGVQKFKEKDQQFIYLNRRAILYDTTSSDPSYHLVTKKDYPVSQFYFENQGIVENYWSKLFSISMNTKLGHRCGLTEKIVILQDINAKPEMISSVTPKTPEAALEADVGYIPGDKLGACCFDSSTWVHVKRNWVWSNSVRKSKRVETPTVAPITGMRKKHMEQVKARSIKYKDLSRELQRKKVKKSLAPTKPIAETKTMPKRNKKVPIIRRLFPRSRKRKLMKYDDLDTRIMKKMGGTRAVWSEAEDVSLSICHFAKKFLCSHTKKKLISPVIIRDIMHRLFPSNRRKTTSAYSRRRLKLIKCDVDGANERYSYYLENDKYLQKVFSKFRNRIVNGDDLPNSHVNIAFVYLVSYVYNSYKKKFMDQQKIKDDDAPIDCLDKIDISKYVKVGDTVRNPDILYQNPQSPEDVELNVIKDIAHCSLGWKSDNSDLPLMLYGAYQHYPDHLLREAISWMRKHQIIAGRKINTKHDWNSKEGMPIAGKLIHNSFVYSFKQITKYPDYIYPEAYQMFATIYKKHDVEREFLVEKIEQGHGLGLSEIACLHNVIFSFKIPDELLVLDPNITDHSQLIQELAVRYKFLIHQKKGLQEGYDQDKIVTDLPENDEGIEKAIEVIFEAQKQISSKVEDESSYIEKRAGETDEVRLTEMDASSVPKEVSQKNSEQHESVTLEASTSKKGFEVQQQMSSTEKDAPSSIGNLVLADVTDKVRPTEMDASSIPKEVSKENGGQNESIIGEASTSKKGVEKIRDSEDTMKALQDLTAYLGNKQGENAVRISDLAYLLTKGLFPEFDGDEERLEKLNKHFLIMYPSSTFRVPANIVGEPWAEEILHNASIKSEEIQGKIKAECIVKDSSHDDEILNSMRDIGAEDEDIKLTFAIVDFIKSKGIYGASSEELKAEFSSTNSGVELHQIILVLIKLGTIFRAGVRDLRFVHVSEKEIWTIGLDDERPISESNLNSLGVRFKVMPWIRINGTLNMKVLHNWMHVIQSYCLSHPFATLLSLMKRFNFLKPVDIFSLLEYLQVLDCLRMYTYENSKPATLFSNTEIHEKRPTNILDDFESIFVETDKIAIIRMGAFKYEGRTDIDIPFEE